MDFKDGVMFDPGFVAHISAIIPNIEYVYGTLNKFRNFGQKKNQFKMFFPKLEKVIDDYIAFYLGCMLWADSIKTIENKPILNNFCCGAEYNEAETVGEVEFLKEYLNQFKKDVKYYIGKDYEINKKYNVILDTYKSFLIKNKGFTELKTTDDIKLPEKINEFDKTKSNNIIEKIEQIVETGNLKELYEFYNDLIQV